MPEHDRGGAAEKKNKEPVWLYFFYVKNLRGS